MSFSSLWFKGLPKEDKEVLINQLKHSILKNQLLEIIEGFEREIVVTKKDYDSPSWSHKQAHQNGLQEALSKIKKLFDQGEQNG